MRQKLPNERYGVTHKFCIYAREPYGRIKGFVTLNWFDDGTPAEIFLTLDTVDEGLRGFARCWALAVSMLLQCREMDVEIVLNKFAFQRFEPAGWTEREEKPETGNLKPEVRAESIVDYIARWMLERMKREREIRRHGTDANSAE